MQKLPRVDVKFDSFPLKGGLDLHTPTLELKPGYARTAQNFECSVNGGYSRIPGYERYDGRVSPTAATYTALVLSTTAGLTVGDGVNGATSGATATVAYIDGTTVVLTKTTGTFSVAENFRKNPTTVIGTVTTVSPTITDQVTNATYTEAAADIYRADITAVGGASCSGSVLGVFVYNGTVYAWRNNAAATAATLWRASGSGWTQITFKYELRYTAGAGSAPAEGATITKGAVSAVVRRVVITSGGSTFAGSSGKIIIDAPTGGSFSAGAFTAGITATCSGAETAITFNPTGRHEVVIGNAGLGVRAYGADGANRSYEFDGTTVVPIDTGFSPDQPTHVSVHKKRLFLAMAASAETSAAGYPYDWSGFTGAAEFAVSQTVTGFLIMPGSSGTAALAILSTDVVNILYGTSSSDWNLVELGHLGVGSVAYAARALNQSYIYSALGVVSLEAVQAYGNFIGNSLTLNLRSFVQARRTSVTDSLINREKSQYRVFYSDGYGLFCTIVNGTFIGAMPVLFPNPVKCACNGAAVNGTEVSYFGSTNGMVYQMDIGTSFDGAAISYSLELNFDAQGSDRIRKRYRKAVFEVQGTSYVQFSAGYSLAYGVESIASTTAASATSGVYWDQFTWDHFTWDGRAIAPTFLSLEGSAENISVLIEGSTALWPTFTINSITLHYTPRRIIR
jgi:hypothetical protein